MRRVAALLSFVALGQSVVLRAGVLCEHAAAGSGVALPMAGMDMDAKDQHDAGAAPGAGSERRAPVGHQHDRSHDGAHCPLMADCVAAAVTVPLTSVSPESRTFAAVQEPRETLPRSETAAPEPPPPKG